MLSKLINRLKSQNFQICIGEIVYVLALSFVLSFVGVLFLNSNLISFKNNDLFSFIYSENMTLNLSKTLLIDSVIFSFIFFILFYFITWLVKPSGLTPISIKKYKNFIYLFILSLFGVLAAAVISSHHYVAGLSASISIAMSLFITGIYYYLIYKLYVEEKNNSNLIYWEIFRFAIVGLVAAVFDFALSYIIQFIIFKGNQNILVTILSTAGGFIIGVVINYLMSTFMVYKAAKSNFSKSLKGILFFVGLAIVGLFIGIGLQTFLYNYLFLTVGVKFFSYPIDFIIRTLIVMIYNYISRKLLIYK